MIEVIDLKKHQFNHLRDIIYSHCGINITDQKKILIETRLRKRLQKLNFKNAEEYLEYLNTEENFEAELVELIDVITTNKTEFFREKDHFEFIVNKVLEKYRPLHSKYNRKELKLWSAACSSGEEPYTLAMILEDYNELHNFLDYSILATDISTTKLNECKKAIYNRIQIEPISDFYRRKYLLRSKDPRSDLYRIVPELREKVTLARVNLKNQINQVEGQFEVIFCRNVIIYFDKATQREIVGNLINKLKPDGYLFMGHSESLYNLNLNVKQVGPSVYQKLN